MTYDQAAFALRGSAAILNFNVEVEKNSLEGMIKSGTDDEACLPVLALKRKHLTRRRWSSSEKFKSREVDEDGSVVVHWCLRIWGVSIWKSF